MFKLFEKKKKNTIEYYRIGDCIFETNKQIIENKDIDNVYHIKSNDLTTTSFSYYQLGTILKRISKEEYESLLENIICDCPFGKRHDIQRSSIQYSTKEMETLANKRFPEYQIKFIETKLYSDGSPGDDIFWITDKFHNRIELSNHPYYYRKACLNCGKCLDEIKDFYELIEAKIEELKKEKLIKDICNG